MTTITLASGTPVAIDDAPYTGRHFLIATGARPRPLDLPGHGLTDHLPHAGSTGYSLFETALIVRRALFRGVFMASDWFDRKVVDGAVDFVGWTGRNAGKFVAQLQTGQVQVYGVGVSAGVIILLWAFLARS